jgi:endonuclease YncB( thermonuclease family)
MLSLKAKLLCFALITPFFIAPALAFRGEVVRVLDGDTIEVLNNKQPQRIRLNGIDCPEKTQSFGTTAKQFTSKFCFGKTVDVKELGHDRYGRTIAEIILQDGKDLNHELVANGLAWWYRKYAPNDSELQKLEQDARTNRRGLWADKNPVAPWDFRHHRTTIDTTNSSAGALQHPASDNSWSSLIQSYRVAARRGTSLTEQVEYCPLDGKILDFSALRITHPVAYVVLDKTELHLPLPPIGTNDNYVLITWDQDYPDVSAELTLVDLTDQKEYLPISRSRRTKSLGANQANFAIPRNTLNHPFLFSFRALEVTRTFDVKSLPDFDIRYEVQCLEGVTMNGEELGVKVHQRLKNLSSLVGAEEPTLTLKVTHPQGSANHHYVRTGSRQSETGWRTLPDGRRIPINQ